MPGINRPVNFDDRVQTQLLHQSLRALKGWHEVTVDPKKRPTTAQRGYYHGVVIPLAAMLLSETQGFDFDDDDAHHYCKQLKRGREVVDPITGQAIVVGRSTKGMAPMQFFAYVDEVVEWLESNNVPVPPPDPNYRRARERAEQQERAAATA